AEKPTLAERFQEIKRTYDRASSPGRRLTDAERRQFIGETYRRRAAIGRDCVALAEANPDAPFAVEALILAVWQVNTNPWPIELVGDDPARGRALVILAEKHLGSEKLASVCQRVSYGCHRDYETFLRAALAKSPNRSVRAAAQMGLGRFLSNRMGRVELCDEQPAVAKEFAGLYGADYLAELRRRDRAAAWREVESLFADALVKFGDAKLPRDELVRDIAERELFDVRNLRPGKTAPEIEGVDQDGKPFKLSDYRGKVVLLDYWSYV
ncbi:MAG TPA: hypothetical protein VNC50_10495, partial [Planctomycetia bacterium]|nr:hypothetical protein [Planctomycetia bacterium]